MDLSALIFVALAVAWAVYLVPKALRHHQEDAVTRSVDKFSDRMRVLARREPVSAREARLVVEGGTTPADPSLPEDDAENEPAPAATAAPTASTSELRRARRAAAARRRRRVLGLLLLANLVVAALAIGAVIAWPWIAVPATLLVAWLVACRLMVRRERVARVAATVERAEKRRTTLADPVIAEELAGDDTSEILAVTDAAPTDAAVAGGWDPVPITLPTYVAKAPVGRTVRTIDLDATGVWSSGRNASDSALARQADEAARAAKTAGDAGGQRATGS